MGGGTGVATGALCSFSRHRAFSEAVIQPRRSVLPLPAALRTVEQGAATSALRLRNFMTALELRPIFGDFLLTVYLRS